MSVELLGHPAFAWIATYLAHSTLLLAVAWAFDAWSRRTGRRERTLGLARERAWKLALFLPLATTLAQRGAGIAVWSLGSAEPMVASIRPVEVAVAPLATHAAPALVAPAGAGSPGTPFPWALACALVWAAGVVLGAASWLREWRSLARALRGLQPCADARLLAEFDALRRGDPELARVRLFVGRQALVPLTLGWVRTRVVVPARVAFELEPDERRALLAHELAHARRRDPLWLSAARAVEWLAFFQPLNRLARVRLQDEAEFLADRWALERGVEPLSLASCLTEVAGWIVSRRALPVPSMAARGARLTRRVERLLEERRAPLPLRRVPGMAAVLVLAVGSAVAAVPGPATRRDALAHASPVATDPGLDVPASVFGVADEPLSLADQLDLLERELEELATAAEERELPEAWHARLQRLREQQERIRALVPVFLELEAGASPDNVTNH